MSGSVFLESCKGAVLGGGEGSSEVRDGVKACHCAHSGKQQGDGCQDVML